MRVLILIEVENIQKGQTSGSIRNENMEENVLNSQKKKKLIIILMVLKTAFKFRHVSRFTHIPVKSRFLQKYIIVYMYHTLCLLTTTWWKRSSHE